MNEAETRAEHIDPALKAAGWGVVEGSRIRREYPITPGRIEGHGKRGKALTADYVLEYRNTKLAVVEAKAWDKPLTEGVARPRTTPGKLAIRFAYATNGQGIYGIDMETGARKASGRLSDAGRTVEPTFAKAERLARPLRRRALRGQGRLASRPLLPGHRHRAGAGGHRRGQERILLTLATGTGKTFIAFQIAWKLFHSRWNLRLEAASRRAGRASCSWPTATSWPIRPTTPSRPSPKMRWCASSPDDIRKKGKVPKNGSLFFTIFQTFMSGPPKDGNPPLLRRVSARLLRLHRHRRVPPRRRQRREQLARHPEYFAPPCSSA
jgi:type I restriction enzyme, R subunit